MNNELIEHLIELRKRIIIIILGFIITFLGLLHFANVIYFYLSKPLLAYMPDGSMLIATDVTSPFFVPLKLTAIVAFILSLPNTAYQIWQFVAPGLYRHERKLIVATTISTLVLFVLGIIFCYFIVLPILFNFISHVKAINIIMLTDINKYLDLVLQLFFIFGCAFQTPIIVFLLIYFNIVGYNRMASMRKYILVGSFIVAAIVTPPDIFSQTLLAIPLYLLYELGVLMGKIIIKPEPAIDSNPLDK